MCFGGSQKAETPAAAPAPALPAPDVPEIGQSRKQESRDLYGEDTPNYRVQRKAVQPGGTGNAITM